jgi:hypothetical protein
VLILLLPPWRLYDLKPTLIPSRDFSFSRPVSFSSSM